MLTADQFTNPWDFLDSKIEECASQRLRTRRLLRRLGWSLRANHPISGVWRASRYTAKGTVRLSAPSAAQLVRMARAEKRDRKRKPTKKEAATDEHVH